MGQSPSNFFPTGLVDCKSADAGVEGARYDYACTADSRVRYGLTIVHLLILVLVWLSALLLYAIYWRVCDRRLAAQLRATPSKRLPVGRDLLSSRMHRIVVRAAARVAGDELLTPPPQAPLVPPPPGSGEGARTRRRYQGAVLSALQRLSALRGVGGVCNPRVRAGGAVGLANTPTAIIHPLHPSYPLQPPP